MDKEEKLQLTNITKIDEFKIIFEKFIFGKELDFGEKTYILSIAILAIKVYEKNTKKKSYLEFAYYIILNYAIKYNDYKPLYDFSVEFGFFPVVNEILNHNLIEKKIKDVFTKVAIDKFNNNSYIETLQQYNMKKSIDIGEKELAIIAPTSFGKSEYIIEHIKISRNTKHRIAIIVPSKSLLVQTYNMIKENVNDMKIIYHDEMFDENDDRFVAVLTQERALRILDNKNIYFDIIYIDEAHNLFRRDSRSILLTRLLRINKLRNPNTQIIYLSPLINEAQKLLLDNEQFIEEKKIDINLKHPEFILKDNRGEFLYNRYSNKFYKTQTKQEYYINYIIDHSLNKNFLYLRNPRDIESFVDEFINYLPDIELDRNLLDLIESLQNEIHKEYWMIKLIKKGVIYLHGKIPDILKEYLEHNFKKHPALKYLVANHVILEGINLPIDNLFILHVYSLKPKDAINLIGRVNRLNYIFGKEINNFKKINSESLFCG
ncbi:DEAD/DEAH box helicase [Lysinibacillus sphaericus]|uniref:DEAD/DEAH box helicase n=1 Tax=Lysinibacillus sphaericus TaxID=1421 RepID=UPI003D71E844